MPPPLPLNPWAMVSPEMVTVIFGAMVNTSTAWPPEMVSRLAPGPAIVMLALIVSVEPKAMVPPFREGAKLMVAPVVAFALVMQALSEPGPVSLRLVTH